MKLVADRLFVSPTDLARFLACRHRTALELAEAQGTVTRPVWTDPLLEALFALGLEHERQYVAWLRATGAAIVDLSEVRDRDDAVARTLAAMREGAEVVVQAAFAHGRWYGRPDILLKQSTPSPALGGWSYEVADTKLARETRGGTILQLGVYCAMLEAVQGRAPERFHVVTPADPDGESSRHVVHTYRAGDFAAYVRLLESRLQAAVVTDAGELADACYPEPVDHCEICPWSPVCRERRRRDDHVSLVAGISRLQRRELAADGIVTVAALAALADPLPIQPRRGALEGYRHVRDQARLQVETRQTGQLAYELIRPPAREARAAAAGPVGFARLPEPSPGDVFLDLEGDALAPAVPGGTGASGETGREYLFGVVTIEDGEARYQAWWADSPAAERQAFEAVVDLVMARRARDPGMHVYHYAPYEPSAFKRLMGRYATREREIDRLLRGRRFVDLYAVVRQGLRAGVERYSIKNIEPLYAFERAVDLRDASRALRAMEGALELDRPELATPEVRAAVEGYNRDDCVSTWRLRDWLEARRADLIADGAELERPPLEEGQESDALDERMQRVETLRAALLAGQPEVVTPSDAGWPDYLVAYSLDWHRREDKAGWWEYFRLRELPEDELFDEPAAVAGLTFDGDRGAIKKSRRLRFRYPPQDMEIRAGDELKMQDGPEFGKVLAIDRVERWIDLKVGPSKADLRPTALFAHSQVSSKVIEDALFDLGTAVADAGGVASLPPCAARDLLLRERPRLAGDSDGMTPRPGESISDVAERIVTTLDRTALAIQGPPGAGKTYTGARMICALAAAGRKVGVVATGHEIIRNLLAAVAREADARGLTVRLAHKDKERDADAVRDDSEQAGAAGKHGRVRRIASNEDALAALDEVDVLGGTAWLWARPEMADTVDVLFVDEAGQMSLANVLGVARAAANVVLLGDPQQLEQPSKGSHPVGVGVSALQHVLGEAETMPDGQGLFLPVTWRLSPRIAEFTSELFYAGALRAKPGLERQVLEGTTRFDGSGLRLVEVVHDGNRNASDEEADEVAAAVADLLRPGSRWIDERGVARQLTPSDIRIVAPFNAHVMRIRERLGRVSGAGAAVAPATVDVPVGTVDKFQGQEAPVSIYSMATSRPEDAPRGLEFLYSLNRLNVATSRARCVTILVASPRLFEPECRTPRQMRLANALCRFRELAAVVPSRAS